LVLRRDPQPDAANFSVGLDQRRSSDNVMGLVGSLATRSTTPARATPPTP
jgi:hypothetical protein